MMKINVTYVPSVYHLYFSQLVTLDIRDLLGRSEPDEVNDIQGEPANTSEVPF